MGGIIKMCKVRYDRCNVVIGGLDNRFLPNGAFGRKGLVGNARPTQQDAYLWMGRGPSLKQSSLSPQVCVTHVTHSGDRPLVVLFYPKPVWGWVGCGHSCMAHGLSWTLAGRSRINTQHLWPHPSQWDMQCVCLGAVIHGHYCSLLIKWAHSHLS